MRFHPRETLFRVLLLCVLACSAVAVYAQEVRATLNGRVQDPSGAAIPNATVTVVNSATGVETSVTSEGDGNYTLPFLVPGTYTLRATASGFKSTERPNVQLHVGDKITVDLNLPVGETSETITVNAAPPLLEDGTASRSGLIDNVRVTELPVVGRNPINYANLLPGVTFQGNPQFIRPFDNGDNANFSINGGLRQTNAFLLDGAPDDAISDTAGDRSHANQNVAYIPTNEATLEFKIINNFYDAQYGRTGGGIFNISTKVGTNDFHGVGYYFMRRYQMDANFIQNKVNGRPLYAQDPVTKANLGGQKIDQYGFVLDGPVVIPHMYNGKDKTFFMFGWENYYEASPSPGLTTVPSVPERNGDFSHSGINIYDPYTTALDGSGNCCTRTQFTNNIIPTSRLQNSAGYKIAQAYPLPNYAANGGDPLTNPVSANNYNTGANLSEDHYRNWIARVDQNFGARERIYGRYAFAHRKQVDNGSANFQGPLIDAQDPLNRTNHNAVLDSITTFGPHITMDLRASFTRYDETVLRQRSSAVDITTLGYSSGFANSRFTGIVPRIHIDNTAGGITDAGSRDTRYGISNITGFQPNVQMIYGKHSIHVGADIRDIRYNTGGGSFVYGSGAFNFNANFTQQNPNATLSPSQGSGIASLLLGTPASGIIQYTPRLGYKWRYYAFYVQDDWKINQRLTLNLGLRYDIEGSPTEQANRQNRGFDFNATSPLAAAATAASSYCPSCSALKGGLLFAGTGGQSKGAFNTQYGNIQPRFGAVFRATNNMIVRGGYGMFYLPEAAFGAAQGFAQDTSFIANQSGNSALLKTPTGSASAPPLNNPFTTILQPTGSSAGLGTFQGQNIIFNNVDRKIPRAQQYSFGLQQQFPGAIKFDVSYVGSRTDHVNTNDNQVGGARNLNVLSNQQIAALRTAALTGGPGGVQIRASDYATQSVTNPFAGLLPGSTLNSSTVARQQLLVPYPQFPINGVSFGQESVGKVWYDSLQLLVEKRYSHGFTLMGAYTWSKTQEALAFLNNQDAKPFKNLSAADRTNRLVISGVLELPFGRNHAFLSHANRAMELLVGGWSLNYIETIQTGTPVDLNGGAYPIRDPRNGVQKSFNQYFNTCVQRAPVFNDTTHSYNAPETKDRTGATCSNPAWIQVNTANLDLRQTPFRASYIRSPSAPIADLSASKKFNITDRVAAQFRFETFNVTNTAIRGNPNMDPNSSQFGFVGISQANQPRRVQLGFRALF